MDSTTQFAAEAASTEPSGLPAAAWRFIGRALEAALAALTLILVAPALGLIAVAIKLDSRGPVLYRCKRIGFRGREFEMLKFRKMWRDAAGPPLTSADDDRFTRLGRVLAATKLDEFPQLWNVVRGDMSIVGPRPIRPAFFEELCEEIPQYWQRLVVEPGMTGFAQLRMTRETSWSEKLAHDLEYIADRSVALYLRVVAATAWRVLTSPFRALAGLASSRP